VPAPEVLGSVENGRRYKSYSAKLKSAILDGS